MSFAFLFFFTLLLLPSAQTQPATPLAWQQATSAADLWQAYPQRVRNLFSALNLEQPGLQNVKAAIHAGDTIAACEALLAYYRQTQKGSWLRSTFVEKSAATDATTEARLLLHDSVSFNSTAVRVPRGSNGGWQWDYRGPEQDEEFGYSLNGHKYFPSLLAAWQQTGNTDYAAVFDRLIRDWIIHHPLPDQTDSIYLVLDASRGLDWRDIGEVEWRTLETGNRLGVSWPQVFYGFQQAEAFTPAARLLMLSSIPEQATYLQKHHKQRHNWTTMEMNGLALAGLAFPEFRQAASWAAYALQVMEEEINHQVYPDGVQTELSTKTQWVALSRFESLAENFMKAGQTVSESYLKRIEEMYHYMAYAMRPDGHQPLNNDSDREDLRPRVLKAAKAYQRPDWQWIATNGKAGRQPENAPSVVFPWAGIHVMRNGWDGQAHWAFFDTGPFGTGHQHSDMLHLSIAAYGKDLLVDGGRYTHKDYWSFDPATWRGYFRSSFSHNVILVDGKGQKGGPATTDQPLKEGHDYMHTRTFDFARGTFDSGFEDVTGDVTHSRAVLYVQNRFWVVADRITTSQPRNLQALWHYAPTCSVAVEGKEVVSTNIGEGNLRITPASHIPWQIEVVQGKSEPYKQGWYSETYGDKLPTPTAVYSADIEKSATFAWILMPARGEVPRIKATVLDASNDMVHMRVEQAGQAPLNLTIPLTEGTPNIE